MKKYCKIVGIGNVRSSCRNYLCICLNYTGSKCSVWEQVMLNWRSFSVSYMCDSWISYTIYFIRYLARYLLLWYYGVENVNRELKTVIYYIDDSTGNVYYEQDLSNIVGAKIVSWNPSEPIQNKFK